MPYCETEVALYLKTKVKSVFP